ncbi:MAG TPA: hypothetical protein VMM12_00735 [Longimicrobiales bacterium]|nr:hypothetical protein [Longimicrobiales bacterium]
MATHPHAALSGAEVSISASTFRTLTTDGGTYRLSIPGVLLTATQARRVTAARTGYDPQVLPLELSPGDSIVVDFVLCPAGSEDGPRAPSLHSPPVASAVTRATGRSMSGALTGVGRRMRGAGEAVASRGPFRTGQERPGPG